MGGSADYIIKRTLVRLSDRVRRHHDQLPALPGASRRRGDRRSLPATARSSSRGVRKELGLDKSKWQQYVIYIEAAWRMATSAPRRITSSRSR